ncbi:hypothetical protein L5515_000915 [Caenorhabditis briggsae]|uniref:Uncharacterized protein n=1 Tax=Caenorhabditis briggsae TaxID=6238 RepID=A0AAE9J2L5_CAEBR|nr:hypothetical protein L5515_000915 [Caenorhabditis briggsae]
MVGHPLVFHSTSPTNGDLLPRLSLSSPSDSGLHSSSSSTNSERPTNNLIAQLNLSSEFILYSVVLLLIRSVSSCNTVITVRFLTE